MSDQQDSTRKLPKGGNSGVNNQDSAATPSMGPGFVQSINFAAGKIPPAGTSNQQQHANSAQPAAPHAHPHPLGPTSDPEELKCRLDELKDRIDAEEQQKKSRHDMLVKAAKQQQHHDAHMAALRAQMDEQPQKTASPWARRHAPAEDDSDDESSSYGESSSSDSEGEGEDDRDSSSNLPSEPGHQGLRLSNSHSRNRHRSHRGEPDIEAEEDESHGSDVDSDEETRKAFEALNKGPLSDGRLG